MLGLVVVLVAQISVSVEQPFRDWNVCPEMITVPAGEFWMGASDDDPDATAAHRPRHRVTISRPFAVGRSEISRGEFRAFVDATGYRLAPGCLRLADDRDDWPDQGGSWTDPGYAQDDTHPVVCVSWFDSLAYAEWLTRRTGRRYRLPSEAEWKYVARGGDDRRHAWGDSPKEQCANANAADEELLAIRPSPAEPLSRSRPIVMGGAKPAARGIPDQIPPSRLR